MQTVGETARQLRSDAIATDQRRLLVLSGDRERCYEGAETAVGAIDAGATVTVSDHDIVGEGVSYDRVGTLLGRTYDCVVVDCHDTCRPNAIGQATGTIDGGGLLILLAPPLSAWTAARGRFAAALAPPPFAVDAVGSRFKRHLLRTLRTHRGVSIVDVDTGRRTKHRRERREPRRPAGRIRPPPDASFPDTVYEACLSADQRDAVAECERLSEAGTAVVLEADRGRGKSSAAGLAAAAFALDGERVVVTAPGYRNAAALFERASELLDSMDVSFEDDRDGGSRPCLRTPTGEIRFLPPGEAVDSDADLVFVDEAAAIPVRTLTGLSSVARGVCFSTTVRGYEGAGRGFDVRFRGTLEESHAVTEIRLSEPIRYAAGDPIEVWLFHALLLDATPPPGQLLAGADPANAVYERLDRDSLADDEPALRDVFGLLVYGHYRTQPDDLARLLDAPEIEIRALTVDGHPVSVALLAREGGLGAGTRRAAYEGDRIRGNLIPDLLTSQLRDPEAGVPVGYRVLRIVTHHAVRSEGFGSRLLDRIAAEFGDRDTDGRAVDYLGVSYGATPELLSFWAANGYRPVHLSTTRNDTSGEHSAVMLRPLSERGIDLADRHGEWFRQRLPGVLPGALRELDPDTVRAVLAAVSADIPVDLAGFEWRLVASAAYGPGLYDTAPGPFRRLALAALVSGVVADPDAERLLVVRVLQNAGWAEAAARLGYVSQRECKRALGAAYRPIVDHYGGEIARREADRYRSE